MNSDRALTSCPHHSAGHTPSQARWSLPVSATDMSALPQHLPAIRVPSSGVPFSPELGLGTGCSGLEKLSQRGGLPGAGCDGKVSHMQESPCAQVSRQKSEKRRRALSPARPGLRGKGASGGAGCARRVAWWRSAGSAVLHRKGKWGPSEWQGEERVIPPIRRRTPPACWASGRPRHWLVSAPPRSSCPRPSSSSGTA